MPVVVIKMFVINIYDNTKNQDADQKQYAIALVWKAGQVK